MVQSSSEKINKIKKLIKIKTGPEDDLKTKIVIPFFKIIGYTDEQYEIGFPIEAYGSKRKGRKPSTDITFFSSSSHNSNTSLLVVEVKREDQEPPLLQAKFYADNLNVPFFITWESLNFQVYQKLPYLEPTLLKSYFLSKMRNEELSEMINFFSPKAIQYFCEKNSIEKFDFSIEKRAIEQEYLKNFSNELKKFKIFDLFRSPDLEKSYIPLYIQKKGRGQFQDIKIETEIKQGIHPVKFEELHRETKQPVIIERAIESSPKIAIIGDPGAGKTTLLKKICLDRCDPSKNQFPIFIAIRDSIALGRTLIDSIHRQIRRYSKTDDPDMIFEKILDEGRLVLCIDGLDELDIREPDEGRKALRILCEELSDLLIRNPKNTFILSARQESWPTCSPEIPPDFIVYEILPFSQQDIRTFIKKWFAQSEYDQKKSLIDEFRINGWPEFATNPLLLSCICVVYENHGRLPDRISSLCSKSIDALLEKWDAIRRISRRGSVPNLSAERKLDILIELAYSFHNKKVACFSRLDVISELEQLLPKMGLKSSDAGTIFDEISTQHGLIKSWSMEELYSFPHLIFQEYLTAKALSKRLDGYLTLIDRKDDPFWNNVFLMYSEIQDATNLLKTLLDFKDNILYSHLFLASKCLRKATTITDVSIRKKIINSLEKLSDSENIFLKQKSIDHLAFLSSEEANRFLQSHIRTKNHKIKPNSYAAKYLIKIEGPQSVNQVISIYKKYKCDPEDLLQSLKWLPQDSSLPLLKDLVETYDYPGESKKIGRDDENRWRRIDAARLMAEVGQEDAISDFEKFINSDTYSNFDRGYFIQILTTIRSPKIPNILEKILRSEKQPIANRILAAEQLAPNNLIAKKFLLFVISNPPSNVYELRDAVRALTKFDLSESDIPYLVPCLNNTNTTFWGPQSFSITALGKIGSIAAIEKMKEANKIWSVSKNKQKRLVKLKISIEIALIDQNETIKFLKNHYNTYEAPGIKRTFSFPFFLELPRMIKKFYNTDDTGALEFFTMVLNSEKISSSLGNSIASAIIRELPSIHLNEKMLESTINLIYQKKWENSFEEQQYWKIMNDIWDRSDMDTSCRNLFFRNGE